MLTLALGIGVTTAMFSAVNTVLLTELPYEDAESVVVLRQENARSYEHWRDGADTVFRNQRDV